jgi:hypothetical protein
MWTALLGPYSVGIVRWRSGASYLTVVAKTTFLLDADGMARPAPAQLGLCSDWPSSAGGEHALEYACDFAPHKARVDVLVVGHAHSRDPRTGLEIAVSLDGLSKRLQALAGAPATAIPLLPVHLRAATGEPRLAAKSWSVPEWSTRTLPEGFDFGRFNVAPADQQLAWLPATPRLRLEGLLPSTACRDAWLPDFEPVAYFMPSRVRPCVPQEISLRRDTLWIHTDRQLATLCWRGVSTEPLGADGSEFLAVAVRAHAAAGWDQIAPLLDRAVWRNAEEDAARPPGPPVEHPWSGAGPAPAVGEARAPGPAAHGPPAKAAVATMVLEQRPTDDDAPDLPTRVHGEVSAPVEQALTLLRASGVTPLVDLPGLSGSPGPAPSAPLGARAAVSSDRASQREAAGGQGSAAGSETDTADTLDDAATGEDEPAPVTPRAGVMLGAGGMGAGLGGMVLCSPTTKEAVLPYRAASPSSSRTPDGPPSQVSPPVDPGSPFPLAAPALPAVQGSPFPLAAPASPAAQATPFPPGAGAPPAAGSAPGMRFQAPPGDDDDDPPDRYAHTAVVHHVATGPALPFLAAQRAQPLASPPAFSPLPLPPQPVQVPVWRPDAPTFPPRAPDPIAQPGSAPLRAPDPIGQPAPLPPPMAAPLTPLVPPAPMAVPMGRGYSPGEPRPPAFSPQPMAQAGPPASQGGELSLPVSTYAAIKVALRDGRAELAEVLAQHGLDARSWKAHERRLAIALSRESREGSRALGDELEAALAEASRGPARGPAGTRLKPDSDLGDYVQLRTELERTRDKTGLLTRAGLTSERWERIHKQWTERARADAELASELRSRLMKARLRNEADGDM